MGIIRPALAWLAAVVLAGPLLGADNPVTGSDDTTAISSKTFNGYIRPKAADGSFIPETYGVAVGGLISGTPTAEEKGFAMPTGDASIDRTTFVEVAGVVEQALAARHYIPTPDPEKAKLLIAVFWGRTAGTNSFSGVIDGAARDLINQRNASLLGFDAEGHLFDLGFNDTSNMMVNIRRQVHSAPLDAVEDDRYIVILEAFDFQKVWKQKVAVRLWETRFSLSQRHTDFRSGLPRMAQAAEHFFGADSHGIAYEAVPEGKVEIGPLKSLGELKGP
jgi:hypothetical protein